MSSEKFTQLSIPCKECLVAPICEDKRVIESNLKEDELMGFFLALRKWDEKDKLYRKGLVEAWANMGWDIISTMKTVEYNQYPENVRPEFVDLINELSGTIQWIINSTSWDKGKKFDFDRDEIKRKLERAMVFI